MKAVSKSELAILNGTTLYTSMVKSISSGMGSSERVVKQSTNAKLRKEIETSPWSGSKIYTVTLEERKTCPDTCKFKFDGDHPCYGNNMPFAVRYTGDESLFSQIESDLAELQAKTDKTNAKRAKDGLAPVFFVVRLHVLGDFFSVGYVASWAKWLGMFPSLRIWGYTHWHPGTEIGDAILSLREACGGLNARNGGRFCIRFSDMEDISLGSALSADLPIAQELLAQKKAFICPEQTGKTESCGTCGLCWMSDKPVIFITH